MSIQPITINPVTFQPRVGASAQPNNNSLAFDPAYDSTLTFDATKQPSVGFEPSAYPGSDAVTQTLLILDQIRKNPSNTTDAQLFLLYTSGLVQNGMIYQPLTTLDGSKTTLDELIASIELNPTIGSTDPESLIACAIDIAIKEKYAQEVAAGNSAWNPTVQYNGQPSFCEYLHSLFPPDENGNYSQVSQQANDEIDNWAAPGGKWSSYQTESEGKDADTLREEASNNWKGDVESSNINNVETELRVDIIHTASKGGKNLMQSIMLLYAIFEMLGMGDLLGLTNQVKWYHDRTDDLNVISGEWSEGFANYDKAYQFDQNVEDYVYEINHAPDGYADQNLIDTVNESLGDGGFLGTTTNLYYKGSDGKYEKANLDYLAQHPNDTYYSKPTGSNSQYIAPDPNLPAKYYANQGNGSSTDIYDINGNRLTYGDLIDNPTQGLYDINKKPIPINSTTPTQATGTNALIYYDWAYTASIKPGYTGKPVDPPATAASIVYYTLDPWELDSTGKNPPPPEYETTTQQIDTNITANTNIASSTSNAVDQMSNWIEAVESAMASAIDTFNNGLDNIVGNDIVS